MNFLEQLFCRHEGMLVHIRDVYGEEIIALPRHNRSIWKCPKCGKLLFKEYLGRDIIYIPRTNMGNVSDGRHTFNELYDYQTRLFATICHVHKDLVWKSKLHSDGSMHKGMFVVGINTPLGQVTYHYDISTYWDLFDVEELEHAPNLHGHTPQEAIHRIGTLRWLKKEES